MNVVLISRTQARLDAAASEIEAKYKVKTKVLAVDYAQADGDTYARLKGELAPLEVRAGSSLPHAACAAAQDAPCMVTQQAVAASKRDAVGVGDLCLASVRGRWGGQPTEAGMLGAVCITGGSQCRALTVRPRVAHLNRHTQGAPAAGGRSACW